MPYNLKHLVHMPNTKQAEIHNSLASALFALLNNFFLQYPVDRRSVSALHSENEEHAEVFESSEAVPAVSSLWAVVWVAQPENRSSLPPRNLQFRVRAQGSRCLSFDTLAVRPPMLCAVIWNPRVFQTAICLYDRFPLFSQPLIVPVRRQLLKHRYANTPGCQWKYMEEGRRGGIF